MSSVWRYLIAGAVCALCIPSLAATSTKAQASTKTLVQWQDDQGHPWRVTKPLPTRWIVLGPHIVDMLTAMGAQQRIVGVQDDHAFPGRYEISLSGHAVVGQSGSISEERVRALKPDLLVYWPTGLSPVQQLRLQRLGLPLLAIAPKKLEDIPERMRWLGALAGVNATAQRMANAEASALTQVRAKYQSGPRLRGFYQVWQQPLFSLSRHHLVSQAMALCGVDSIVPAGDIEAPMLNAEAVLAARTEIIFAGKDQLAQARAFWQRFSTLPAVRQDAIVGIDDYALTRPGLSLLRAIPALCQAVLPWRIRQSVQESQ